MYYGIIYTHRLKYMTEQNRLLWYTSDQWRADKRQLGPIDPTFFQNVVIKYKYFQFFFKIERVSGMGLPVLSIMR